MKASEAKKLTKATNTNSSSEAEGIFSQIEEAAKSGLNSITLDEALGFSVVQELEQSGYTVGPDVVMFGKFSKQISW